MHVCEFCVCVCVCVCVVFYGRTKQRFPRDIAQEVCPRPIAHRLIRRGYSSLHKSLIADFQWAIRHAGQPLAGAEGIKRRGMHVNTEDLLLTSAKLQLPTSETVRVIPASPSSKDVHIRTYIRTYICTYVRITVKRHFQGYHSLTNQITLPFLAVVSDD